MRSRPAERRRVAVFAATAIVTGIGAVTAAGVLAAGGVTQPQPSPAGTAAPELVATPASPARLDPRTARPPASTDPPPVAPPTSPAGAAPATNPVAATKPLPVAPASVTIHAARSASAPVIPVGVLPDGNLQIPEDPRQVGWWAASAPPGASHGALVLAGHVDSHRYGIGTFAALHDVAVGATIEIIDAADRPHQFVVSEVRQTPKAELPTDLLTSDGPMRLVMISCGGRFDADARRYADNIIVVAAPAAGDAGRSSSSADGHPPATNRGAT